MEKIGFGGSCHWCTEAIFQSLKGVSEVQQGWIASDASSHGFSEAVIVTYNPEDISLETLIAVHLHTHSSTAEHSMRQKYRSAIYTFKKEQQPGAQTALENMQAKFARPIITKVLPFGEFKLNKTEYLNYYYSNPKKPFCQNIVTPKLRLLLQRFAAVVKPYLL
jgi:peptide-methionine (S)-S-oxide reductase